MSYRSVPTAIFNYNFLFSTFHNLQFPLQCSYNSENHVYNSFLLYKEINFSLAKYWTVISTEVWRWGWGSNS